MKRNHFKLPFEIAHHALCFLLKIFIGSSKTVLGMSLHYTINEKLASLLLIPSSPLALCENFTKLTLRHSSAGALYYTPHRNRLSAQRQSFFCIPGSQEQWPPSHKAATPALTTSSPLQQDKTWPGGSIYTRLSVFQEKRLHALAAIFFLSGCVWISDFATSRL